MHYFKNTKRKMSDVIPSGILALIFALVGLSCIFFYDRLYDSFNYVIGSAMVAGGLFVMIKGLISGEYKIHEESKRTAIGIIVCVVGAVIIIEGRNADTLIGGAWGMFGLAKGAESLDSALYYLSCKKKYFIYELFSAAADIILAIILLLDPEGHLEYHILILGIEILVLAIQMFIENNKVSQKEV